MTRTISTLSSILLLLLFSTSASGANKSAHPYLFVDDAEFSAMKKEIFSGRNKALSIMHESYIQMADKCVSEDKTIEYAPNTSGKLLLVSREALRQIACCSYAYRFTKDRRYLWRAESVLTDVCSFDTWHPEHYLDVAEMALAVSIGYDWLYSKLDPKTRSLCEKAIDSYLFDTADDGSEYRQLFRKTNNWGQVLNCGLIASCIAFKDVYPERSDRLLKRAVADNSEFIACSYAPDGVYPEGSTYWGYGTTFQIMLIRALEKYTGSDSGLSLCQGFENSAWFKVFAEGCSGKAFNYSDSGEKVSSSPVLWYFADRFGNPEIVYKEKMRVENTKNYQIGESRTAFLWIYYASKVNVGDIKAPSGLIFSGRGPQPLVMARTGWAKNDLYLGIKGGGAKNGHAHLDAGSFVFDAFGKRWIEDPGAPGYARSEKALRTIKSTPWKMNQTSHRWKIYGYNNRQHSTMTINGADHKVTGTGLLVHIIDSAGLRGGEFDLSSIFEGEAAYVGRTGVIGGKALLELRDSIVALPGKDASVKWVFPTKSSVEKTDGGYILTQKGQKVMLRTDAAVTFEEGMELPENVPECLMQFYGDKKATNFIGFRLNVPAGGTSVVNTTIEKL